MSWLNNLYFHNKQKRDWAVQNSSEFVKLQGFGPDSLL